MAKLFAKEKDIFLKIINSILVLWVIVAIVITLAVGINIVNRERVLTYEEYKTEKCDLDKIPTEEIDIDEIKENCYESYKYDKQNINRINKQNNNNFLIGLSNILIVSLFLNLLNKKVK